MRIRTTKKLGQRVDRTYLGHLFPVPLWRRIITGGCLAIVLAWLGLYAAARNQTPYTAGPLTPSHAFLGKQCVNCHGADAAIGTKVADQQCQSCHDAPLHNAEQVVNPPCRTCHVEHRGELQLSGVLDRGCVGCHSNLRTKSGRFTVAAHIGSFTGHPQFSAIAQPRPDIGLKFNHAKHAGELQQKCTDCHTPSEATGGRAPHSRTSSRALMSIPTFAGTCMPCHALNFDDKISDPAPHDKPEAVDAFVQSALAKYIAAHPGDLGKDGTPRSPSAWVRFRTEADEKQLKETTCARCHDTSGYPAIPPVKIAPRVFAKASFDHAAHQAIMCGSCHPKAAVSASSADQLVPGIETCRQCHNSGKTSAGDSCASCHVYHDWTKAKPVDGKYTPEKMM